MSNDNNSSEKETTEIKESIDNTEEIIQQIQTILGQIFTKEFLDSNPVIQSQVNNVPLSLPTSAIFQCPAILSLTTDLDIIRRALETSNSIIVTENIVRPNIKAEQHTIILREVEENVSEEEIREMFTKALCPEVVSCRSETNNTWFVMFGSEADARSVLEKIKNSSLGGKSVRARLKTESLIRRATSGSSNTSPTYRVPPPPLVIDESNPNLANQTPPQNPLPQQFYFPPMMHMMSPNMSPNQVPGSPQFPPNMPGVYYMYPPMPNGFPMHPMHPMGSPVFMGGVWPPPPYHMMQISPKLNGTPNSQGRGKPKQKSPRNTSNQQYPRNQNRSYKNSQTQSNPNPHSHSDSDSGIQNQNSQPVAAPIEIREQDTVSELQQQQQQPQPQPQSQQQQQQQSQSQSQLGDNKNTNNNINNNHIHHNNHTNTTHSSNNNNNHYQHHNSNNYNNANKKKLPKKKKDLNSDSTTSVDGLKQNSNVTNDPSSSIEEKLKRETPSQSHQSQNGKQQQQHHHHTHPENYNSSKGRGKDGKDRTKQGKNPNTSSQKPEHKFNMDADFPTLHNAPVSASSGTPSNPSISASGGTGISWAARIAKVTPQVVEKSSKSNHHSHSEITSHEFDQEQHEFKISFGNVPISSSSTTDIILPSHSHSSGTSSSSTYSSKEIKSSNRSIPVCHDDAIIMSSSQEKVEYVPISFGAFEASPIVSTVNHEIELNGNVENR